MSKRSSKVKSDLARVGAMRDEDVDYSEIAELDDSFWKSAVFMPNGIDMDKLPSRAKKAAISVRLDDDVLAWLKKPGDGYQKRLNGILRHVMLSQRPTSRERPVPGEVATARPRAAKKKVSTRGSR
ncbi:MAG: hypothetical protein RLZZ450_2746 [Pseudomonadota bacterium]